MKEYPSILGSRKAYHWLNKPCVAFYKYDGSNLRWEWSAKKGWYKFGTRTQLFDATNPVFGKAIPIFMNGMADEIVSRILKKHPKMERITVFTEFFGPNSFAGQHVETDPMELRLLDIFLYKKDYIPAIELVDQFGDLPYAPEVVYRGPLTQEFVEAVRKGDFPVWEGVVAKGSDWWLKIKTDAYFAKLFEVYGKNYSQFWE